MASSSSESPNDGAAKPAGRGKKLLLRLLLLLLLLGLLGGIGFACWAYRSTLLSLFSSKQTTETHSSAVELIPFCDSLSQTVYALKLTSGYGEILPVLHDTGGGLAQCGEGAENGYGRVILKKGKAVHVLPQRAKK
ncbi:MAG: hypothetical protein IJU65_04410 [Desulfovibrio sp.]|nr:hypothetical protein [Desulfovibrio sp.]